MAEADKPLLILDVDETLVLAGLPVNRPPDLVVCGYAVYTRPFLLEFINSAAEDYRLAVWSSGGMVYIHSVLQEFWPLETVPLEFIWTSERCGRYYNAEWRESKFGLKDLKKVKRAGYDLTRTLIVDNDPWKCRKNYGNAIYVRDYEGDTEDNELSLLSVYLHSIRDHENYRNLEKRGWRATARNLINGQSGL